MENSRIFQSKILEFSNRMESHGTFQNHPIENSRTFQLDSQSDLVIGFEVRIIFTSHFTVY